MTTFKPRAHPFLPLPAPDDVARELATDEGAARLAEFYAARERRIDLADADPYRYVFEPPIWNRCDQLLREHRFLTCFGANRTTKSHYAAYRVVQAAMHYPHTLILCGTETETSSINTQQALVWHYLPLAMKKLSSRKHHAVIKINYTVANGFSDRKLVLPNRSQIHFVTWNMSATDYEGWEFGNREFPVLGAWADESMPLSWLEMFNRRLRFRNAKGLWTFTPVRGITPAIKSMIGPAAQCLESAPADLLPAAQLPGLPRGHMPVVARASPSYDDAVCIYFHLGSNPFGNYTNQVRTLVEGKTTEYIERVAYGYARDSALRAFPLFSAINIIAREKLPKTRTNFLFVDPAGARNWAMIWVGVTPGNPPYFYIYRDWPDAQHYGEWAVPTEREVNSDTRKGWDGDPGPAQNTFGYGTVRYKQLIIELETIRGPDPDPYRNARFELAASKGIQTPILEHITLRYIDPRAAANPMQTEEVGGMRLLDYLAQKDVDDASGRVLSDPMWFTPALGVSEDEGVVAVNRLLEYNPEAPIVSVINEPRLYVSSECRQVIWTLENYTGLAGPKGACKDFADLLRYLALANLWHYDHDNTRTKGGGSY